MYLMRISQTTRRNVNDPTKATLSPHNNSVATGRVESDVEQSKWIRLSGEAKRYNRCVRRPAHNASGPNGFGSDRLLLHCE